MNLEKERKYLIEIPLKWYGKFKVLTADRVKIFQTYLLEKNPETKQIETTRVRAAFSYCNKKEDVIFTHTKKVHVSPGVNEEYETILTGKEYRDMLTLADPNKHRITKTRYILDFDDKKFEFDVFEDKLLGLGILELEVDDMEEQILTPPYLKVIKEVTRDVYYSNAHLATLSYYLPKSIASEEKIRFPRRVD